MLYEAMKKDYDKIQDELSPFNLQVRLADKKVDTGIIHWVTDKYQVKITGKDGNEYIRTKCDVYTRVMGYFRPVSQFNIGKKSEFYSRKYFDENKIANSDFIKQYK